MILGSRPGCASAFQPVYWRIWRIEEGKSRLLLEESKLANVGDDPPIRGSITPTDATVDFSLGGTGWGFPWNTIRHYSVNGDQVKQTGPTVRTPRDFVEEWLDTKAPPKLRRKDSTGDFPDPPLHCSSALWQIATRLTREPQKTYFLIRWNQPYDFQMLKTSQQPICSSPVK